MQSPILRPSLQWRCLLLVFMAIPVAATPEEGTILKNWLRNITSASNALASWRDNLTDPCGINADWYGVSCGNSSNVLSINLRDAQISGPLVPELGQLSLLTSLILDSNEFNGLIPQEFGNLSALTYLSLSGNILAGSIPSSLGKLTKLEYLYLDNNVLTGSMPQELGSLPVLTNLTLGRNRLKGAIPFTNVLYNKLENLDLNDNYFTGPYPESLASFPFLYNINLDSNSISGMLNVGRILELLSTTGAMYNISYVNQSMSLMNNNITDISLEYGTLQVKPTIYFKLIGNPYCAGYTEFYDDIKRCLCQQDFLCYFPYHPPSPAPTEPPNAPSAPKRSSVSSPLGMIIGIICGTIFLLAIIIGVIIKRLARRKPSKLEDEYKQKFAELEVNPQPFLYKVLRVATLEFNESTKLGQGGFGTVYKGTLSNGNEVAIKKLKPRLAAQGEVDDFLNEVSFITKMKHPNLVNLKGYCIRGKERMLVYEYVENMDLEQSLLLGRDMEAMTWAVRFNICLGVAQGLHYLHEVATPRVIHRDIKASNILLGAQYEPKIGDFGLALLFPDNETHISLATIAGTKGYLAPEYASFGQLSEKSDVYSFGVLCLEIVSGRKNIDQSKPPNQVYLATWAWSLYEKKSLKDLIDPSLHLRIAEEKKALRVINIALSCLQQFPQRRPSMNDVQSALQGNRMLDEVEPFPMKEMINFDSILEDTALMSSLSIEGTGQST